MKREEQNIFLLLLFGKIVWHKMEEIEEEMKNA